MADAASIPVLAEPHARSQPVVLRMQPWLFLCCLGVAHIAFAALYAQTGGYIDWLEGIKESQPVLFAIWFALGTGRFAVRAQVTALMFAALLWATAVAAAPTAKLSIEDMLVESGWFILIGTCLTLVRRWKGVTVAREVDWNANNQHSARYDTKSLFWATATIAILLIVGRYVLPRLDRTQDIETWAEVVILICIGGSTMVAFILVTLLTLSQSFVSKLTLYSVGCWWLSVIAHAQVLAILDPSFPDRFEEVFYFTLCGTLACVATALPLRLAGYRLRQQLPGGTTI